MLASILKTICYADMFDYSLTLNQIYQFLIGDKVYTYKEIEKGVNQLVKTGKINQINPNTTNYIKMYTLSGREAIVLKTLANNEFSHQKIDTTNNIIGWLKLIPTLQAVFITGSLAMNNARKTDDIDLMLICKPGTLWRTRLCVTLVLEALFVRRKPESLKTQASVTDKFCPNLYLSETKLAISPDKQNLYTAHEVVQAKVVFDKSNIRKKLLDQNKWVRLYLPHSPTSPGKTLNHSVKYNKNLPYMESLFENFVYKLQKNYMKPRLTRELVSPDAAFFHPRDTHREVMKAYNSRLKSYLS